MKKLFLVFLLITTITLIGCNGTTTKTGTSKIPSGNNCAENVAYLQEGVNKYKEAVGDYPLEVDELLNTKNGKGPFVEIVPKCPTGNQYIIENGNVREAPIQ